MLSDLVRYYGDKLQTTCSLIVKYTIYFLICIFWLYKYLDSHVFIPQTSDCHHMSLVPSTSDMGIHDEIKLLTYDIREWCGIILVGAAISL